MLSQRHFVTFSSTFYVNFDNLTFMRLPNLPRPRHHPELDGVITRCVNLQLWDEGTGNLRLRWVDENNVPGMSGWILNL